MASEPTCLIVALVADVMDGLDASCPGRSSITSPSDVAWRWSMAAREIVDAVEAPTELGFAVTTTSSNLKDDSDMDIVMIPMSLRTSTSAL